jgi:hypothetical protein
MCFFMNIKEYEDQKMEKKFNTKMKIINKNKTQFNVNRLKSSFLYVLQCNKETF